MRGRPMTLESQIAELALEIQTLSHQSAQLELERLRAARQLATLADQASRRAASQYHEATA